MKSITVEAKIENVDKVTEFVNEVLEEKDCPLKVQMQLDVAIDEIFGNIAYYAYGKGSGHSTIQIEMEDNPPKITLIFIDQGTPYNPYTIGSSHHLVHSKKLVHYTALRHTPLRQYSKEHALFS